MTVEAPAPARQARQSEPARRRRRTWPSKRTGFLLTAPAVLAIGLLVLYPLGYSINESLHRSSGSFTLHNYRIALANPAFRTSFKNTIAFTVIMVVTEIVLGLAVALALQTIGPRKRAILRALFMIPLLVAPVVAAYEWGWMLNDQFGVVNQFFHWAGATPPLWLSNPHWAFAAVVVVDVWIATPFSILIFSSALSALSPEIYEAARLEGASPVQTFWYITRPLLKPAFLIVLVIRTMDAFRTYDAIAVLTGGGPGLSTSSLSILTVKTGIDNGSLHLASAMSILTLLPILVVTLVYLRIIRIAS
jgi:multiple sugar transport system permease protein